MSKGKGKRQFKITINRAWCKDCGICTAFCPTEVFDTGKRGEPIVARPDDCTGCGQCMDRCPDFALDVVSDQDQGETNVRAS